MRRSLFSSLIILSIFFLIFFLWKSTSAVYIDADDIFNNDCVSWKNTTLQCGGYGDCDSQEPVGGGGEYDNEVSGYYLEAYALAETDGLLCTTGMNSTANLSVLSNVDSIRLNLSYQTQTAGTTNCTSFRAKLFLYNYSSSDWFLAAYNYSVNPTSTTRWLNSGWLNPDDFIANNKITIKNLIEVTSDDDYSGCSAYFLENYQEYNSTCLPPASGDWIIDTEHCVLTVDDTLNGDLFLTNNGKLTLNANLTFQRTIGSELIVLEDFEDVSEWGGEMGDWEDPLVSSVQVKEGIYSVLLNYSIELDDAWNFGMLTASPWSPARDLSDIEYIEFWFFANQTPFDSAVSWGEFVLASTGTPDACDGRPYTREWKIHLNNITSGAEAWNQIILPIDSYSYLGASFNLSSVTHACLWEMGFNVGNFSLHYMDNLTAWAEISNSSKEIYIDSGSQIIINKGGGVNSGP